MIGCFKEMIFAYIDSPDVSLSNGADRSPLSRFIQKLLKKHQVLLYFETDISILVASIAVTNIPAIPVLLVTSILVYQYCWSPVYCCTRNIGDQ